MANWQNGGPFNQSSGNTAGNQSVKRKATGLFTKGNVGFGVVDAAMNMAGGDDAGTAILKAGASAALWHTAPGIMAAYTFATTAPQLASAGYTWHRQQKQWWNSQHMQGTVGGNYVDTQRALTMRQAAVEAIQGSKMNARSALGGEARILNGNWNRP